MNLLPLATLCDAVRPGERVFVSGASGEPADFLDAWLARPRGAQLVTSFVPGINPLAPDRLPADVPTTGLFAHPGLDAATGDGRYRVLPLAYSGFVRHLSAAPPDWLVVQVAPPDAAGRASLGPHAEFVPTVLAAGARVLAIVDPHVPRLPNAPAIDLADAAMIAESRAPLRRYAAGDPDPASVAIARHVAPFVVDGATIQIGIGKVPPALLALLADRRGLRFWSGMISAGVRPLVEAGAIDPAPGALVACSLLGDAGFYDWCRDRPDLTVAGCEVTHHAARLAAVPRLVAINSAIEVDLLGQANLETVAGRAISGAGGAPDFARAASAAVDGVSIVALPATTPKDASRVVAALGAGAPASLARHMIDVIVTEHGAADLRGRSVRERAEAIAAVAAPGHRDALLAAIR